MDEAAGNSIAREDGSNLSRLQPEAPRKVEGQLGGITRVLDRGVVEEDGHVLVVGNRVERQECVDQKVEECLPSEDVHGTRRWKSASGALFGHDVARDEWCRGFAIHKGAAAVGVGRTRKGAGETLSHEQPPVLLLTFGGEGLSEEKRRHGDREQEEDTGYQVGQEVRKALKQCRVAEEGRKLLGRLSKEAAKTRADDRAERPDKRHDGECSRLKFLFRDHFGHHSSDDAN